MANTELPKDAEGRGIPPDTPEAPTAGGTTAHAVGSGHMYRARGARGPAAMSPGRCGQKGVGHDRR